MRAAIVLLLALPALFLAGCVEIDEHWTFEPQGGGTYALRVSWDADLWRRAREALGPTATRALTRRAPVPLRAQALRDGLTGLAGVEVTKLTETTAENGYRTITLHVRFTSLGHLWQWEVLARRPMRLALTKGDPATARLVMQPLRRLAVLDEAAALRARLRRDPGQQTHPQGVLARWGVDSERLRLVWDMVKVAVTKTRYRARVDVPGRVRATNEAPAMRDEQTATFSFDWDQLKAGPAKRRFSLTWDVSELDVVKPARHRMPPARGR